MKPWQQFRWILRNTKLSTDHLTPELKLRLITPDCPMFMAQPEDCPFPDPYWGFYWPGGQGMSRYILDNSKKFQNKKVLDFGSGCGASGIAAGMAGASAVSFCDIDETALLMAMTNARLNPLPKHILSFSAKNYLKAANLQEVADISDIILLGDMFYDSDFASQIIRMLHSVWKHRPEIMVLIGDPGRHGLDSMQRNDQMRELELYSLPPNIAAQGWGFPTTAVSQLINPNYQFSNERSARMHSTPGSSG